MTLVGDMTAGAYIKVYGNAKVTGNITTTGTADDHVINIGGTADISGNLKGNKQVTVGGNAKVGGDIEAGTKASFGGDLTMAAGKTLTAQNLEIGGALGLNDKAPAGSQASLTATNSMTLSGNVSNVSLTAHDITIGTAGGSAVELNEVDITLTGGELTLHEVVVTGNSSFINTAENTNGIVNLTADNVTFKLQEGVNSEMVSLEPQTYTLMLLSESVQEGAAQKTLVINSDMLKNLNISGSVTLDLSDYAQEIKDGGYSNVTLAFADDMSYTETSTVQATLDGTTFVTAAPSGDNTSTFEVSKLSGDAVPEPTTATLSLLALAALAARRRRK